MPAKDEFVAAARSYLGVRWLHQGRNRLGVDCVGLIIAAARDIGVEVPDMRGYRRSPDPQKFLGHIYENSIPEQEPIPGSFGVFRDGTQPCHVGIFAEQNGLVSLIHSYSRLGKVIEEEFTHEWPRNLVAIRSIESMI